MTPTARLSFPHLFEPAAPFSADQEPKYQCDLIFAPDEFLSEIEDAIDAAIVAKWGSEQPKRIRRPLKDAADKDAVGYVDGCQYVTARSKRRPAVVQGRLREPVTDPDEIYGGCYVRASLTAFGYDVSGSRGVSLALNNIWKIRDGEPFGQRRSAEDDFADVEVDRGAFGDDAGLL